MLYMNRKKKNVRLLRNNVQTFGFLFYKLNLSNWIYMRSRFVISYENSYTFKLLRPCVFFLLLCAFISSFTIVTRSIERFLAGIFCFFMIRNALWVAHKMRLLLFFCFVVRAVRIIRSGLNTRSEETRRIASKITNPNLLYSSTVFHGNYTWSEHKRRSRRQSIRYSVQSCRLDF